MTNFTYSRKFDGIIQVFMRRGDYYRPLLGFLENVMVAESGLTKIERELIAAYVSAINGCRFCVEAHRETMRALGADEAMLSSIEEPRERIEGISEDLRQLLALAEKITVDPHGIKEELDIAPLRRLGIDEETIEDTANVAALFNLVNRLVDTFGVKGSDSHFEMVGRSLASSGYLGG